MTYIRPFQLGDVVRLQPKEGPDESIVGIER